MTISDRLERLAQTVERITRRADARGLRKRAEIHKGENE